MFSAFLPRGSHYLTGAKAWKKSEREKILGANILRQKPKQKQEQNKQRNIKNSKS